MSRIIFILLLLMVFIIELAVMKMFEPLLATLSPLLAGLTDATILVLLFAPPLWILCTQLTSTGSQEPVGQALRSGRVLLFCKLMALVCMAEFLVMYLLYAFLPEISVNYLPLLDAGLTVLIVLPIARRILSNCEQSFHSPTLADLLGSPVMVYSAMLYLVFLADTIQESIQPYLTPEGFEDYFILIDSTLTTIFIAPFVWLIVGKPLVIAAQEEKSRVNTIVDQVVDAIVTLDDRGRVCSINPAAKKLFGYASDEIEGRSFDMLFVEEPLAIKKVLSESSNGHACERELMLKETICKNHNGKILTVDISLSGIRQQGHDEWLLILHDISHHKETARALRERDERFRQIFEQSDDAIAFFKPDTCNIVDVNSTFVELFGYSKTEILQGGLDHLIAFKDLSLVSGAIRKSSMGLPSKLDNFSGLDCNGRQFFMSMRSKLMTIDNVDIVFCSFRNITSRIQLEKEAKAIQTKLIQANKMTSLGLMVSGVAHEINNPNNFILANSSLLASTWGDARKILLEYYREHGDFCLGGIPFTELDEQYPQLLSGVLDGSVRIKEIINNLKNFYRPDRATKDCVDVNRVATSAASLLQHELVKYTKNFHMKLAENLPSIQGNEQQIGQVVINLLINACQSLPSKKHGIWMETGFDPDAAQVSLTIKDEGRGMTPEESQRVMEPFFTTKLDEGGTGLGLTICKSIILEHHGTLDFESISGEGTTFVVRLPADLSAVKD